MNTFATWLSHIRTCVSASKPSIILPHRTETVALGACLLRNGFLSSLTTHPVSLQPKIRDGRPVLTGISLVSKPSQPVFLGPEEMAAFNKGRKQLSTPGLGFGQVAFVRCVVDAMGRDAFLQHVSGSQVIVQQDAVKELFMDSREAVERNLGGEVIARIW